MNSCLSESRDMSNSLAFSATSLFYVFSWRKFFVFQCFICLDWVHLYPILSRITLPSVKQWQRPFATWHCIFLSSRNYDVDSSGSFILPDSQRQLLFILLAVWWHSFIYHCLVAFLIKEKRKQTHFQLDHAEMSLLCLKRLGQPLELALELGTSPFSFVNFSVWPWTSVTKKNYCFPQIIIL